MATSDPMPLRRTSAPVTPPPKWIKPQLTRLVDEAPAGKDWLHEIKYDGYPASFAPSPTRAASVAAMNSSRSPSSTFCGSERSTLVRRSFTI